MARSTKDTPRFRSDNPSYKLQERNDQTEVNRAILHDEYIERRWRRARVQPVSVTRVRKSAREFDSIDSGHLEENPGESDELISSTE